MPSVVSLYRRHRPRTFDDVVGQELIVRTLRNAIELGKVHHAYLFVGSRGTGKTSMAKLLACALNAEGGPRTDFSPDDPVCVAIARGDSLDVVEMDAASNNSVDDIRELRETVALSPMGGGRRVYILDEAHMLSQAAWNAFLKTLEEPPAHAVFVLATTEAHKVPATIVDRCHRFDFARPSLEQIVSVLRRVAVEEGIEASDAVLAMIARAAAGSFRDALGTLEQLVTYGGKEVRLDDVLEVLGVADADLVLETAEALVEHDAKRALLAVEKLSSSGRDIAQFMRDLAAHLRHLFVVQTLGDVPDSFSVTSEHTDRLTSQASRLPQGEILRAIDLLGAALVAVRDGSEPRVQLEMALLKAVQPHADLSLPALLFRLERLEALLAGGTAAPGASGPAPGNGSSSGAAGRSGDDPSERPAEAPSSGESGDEGTGPQPADEEASPPVAAADSPRGAPADPDTPAITATAAASTPTPSGVVATVDAPHEALDLDHLQALWPAAVDTVRVENGLVGALIAEARPAALDGDRLTIAFPTTAEFSKRKAEGDANRSLLQTTLRGLTGRSLQLVYELSGEVDPGPAGGPTLSEQELLDRLKAEFEAEEVAGDPETPSGQD